MLCDMLSGMSREQSIDKGASWTGSTLTNPRCSLAADDTGLRFWTPVSLPKSRAGYNTAMIFVDKFTKMTQIAPTIQQCTGADVRTQRPTMP